MPTGASPAATSEHRDTYAYLGPEGTFTEAALRQVASPNEANFAPQPDVLAAIGAVRSGEADFAVVPIENSVEGGVNATIDSLTNGITLHIRREMVVPVSFTLAARPGTSLAEVSHIGTHPHAWAQCRQWVAAHVPGARHLPTGSTAAAAAQLAEAERGGPEPGFEAALVAPLSAEMYGLAELATAIADNPNALTRFVLLGRPAAPAPPTGRDRTTVLVHLPHDNAGALLEMLEQFSARGVNLSRIESRPIGDALGRYAFSVDIEGHVAEARVGEALMGLKRVCPLVRFLGSYPTAAAERALSPMPLKPGTLDENFAEARDWVEALRSGPGTPEGALT